MQFKNLHILALAIAAQSANAHLNVESIASSLNSTASATPSETPAAMPVRLACIFQFFLGCLPLTHRL